MGPKTEDKLEFWPRGFNFNATTLILIQTGLEKVVSGSVQSCLVELKIPKDAFLHASESPSCRSNIKHRESMGNRISVFLLFLQFGISFAAPEQVEHTLTNLRC